MAKETPIINIFTYGLPYDLTHQIYNEFQDRLRETNYILEKADRYSSLKKNFQTVEILLALSIFHKRVIANLDAAVKFHGTVLSYSQSDIIKIGNYELTTDEKNKILGLLMNYRQLMERFNLPETLWDYSLTKEFLLKLINLKSDFDYAETQAKNSKGQKNRNKKDNGTEDELPF